MGEKPAWLLIGLSVLALGLTSPAVTFLLTFLSRPADWGRLYFCSAMLLPAVCPHRSRPDARIPQAIV